MVKRKLSAFRKAQKKMLEGLSAAADGASRAADTVGDHLNKLDETHDISSSVRDTGSKAASAIRDFSNEYGITTTAQNTSSTLSAAARKATNELDQMADKVGLYDAAKTISASSSSVLAQHGINKHLATLARASEDLYGSARQIIKPYFPAETPDELLLNTKQELTYISACIMQISPGEAEKIATQFGTVVASKIAGLAATGALFSLVSTFGTAGTGTAIASLSGAASTSATLAWVGGLLGGGMATGALLTGGVGIVVGLSAYKSLSSEKREFEDLDEIEQRIVQYCWMLIAILDDHLNQKEHTFSATQARSLLADTLLPLQKLLQDEAQTICSNLDNKNAAAYRQHVLRDFQPAVIEAFEVFIEEDSKSASKHYEYIIGGVIYALITNSAVDNSPESQMVLYGIRDSDPDLANATEAELSDYLAGYSPEQLKGIANNVKGIYHEIRYVEQYNATHTDTRAERFESNSHPGADIRIINIHTGELVEETQLKATDSKSYAGEHHTSYPDVNLKTTDELAGRMDNVEPSGFTNEGLTAETTDGIEAIANNTLDDRVLDSTGIALTIATGQELVAMLQGKREFPDSVKQTIKKVGTAGATTAISAYLFS